jgi:hypothetical protein
MSTIHDFGIPGISNTISQPKLKHHWRVSYIGIGAQGSSSQALSAQTVSATRPNLSFEEVELNRYNSKSYVATKHSWEPCEVVVEDDVLSTASQIVSDQLQKQQWLIGGEGPFLGTSQEGSIYKFAMKLELLDGREQPIEKWVLQGCWIKDAKYGELNYGEHDALQINLTIRYDHAYQELGGYNAGGGLSLGGAGS